MTLHPCNRQPEVRELLSNGHWPNASPQDLRAHVAACRSCTDLLLVTQAFQRARKSAVAQAQLPAAGAIWWRAQLRRRNAAVERMGKPVMGAYIFALVLAALVAVTFVVNQARNGLRWLAWFVQSDPSQTAAAHPQSFSPAALLNSSGTLLVLISVFATLALVGAVAVYLGAERQ